MCRIVYCPKHTIRDWQLSTKPYNLRILVIVHCSLLFVIYFLSFVVSQFSVLATTVRPKDQIWEEWTDCGKDVDGKNQGECNYCGQRLQVNVTRFKQHTVLVCRDTP